MKIKIKRVAVIGSPGAGKSTFARKLGEITGLPVVHLDTEHHRKDKDYYTNTSRWDAYALSEIEKEKWIIEGNFSSTFEQRFSRADTVIYIDTPRWLTIPRLFRRLFHRSPERRPEMPEGWTEKFNYKFFRYAWRFKHKRRPIYFSMLSQLPENKNIVKLSNRREANSFLHDIITSNDSTKVA